MNDNNDPKTNEELLSELMSLKNPENLSKFLEDNKKSLDSYNALRFFESCWIKYGFVTQAQVIKRSELGHNAYHYLDGRKKLTRNRAICLSLAVGMDIDETNTFLQYLGLAQLYVRNSRDVMLIYAINQKMSVHDTNTMLYEADLDVLCTEK